MTLFSGKYDFNLYSLRCLPTIMSLRFPFETKTRLTLVLWMCWCWNSESNSGSLKYDWSWSTQTCDWAESPAGRLPPATSADSNNLKTERSRISFKWDLQFKFGNLECFVWCGAEIPNYVPKCLNRQIKKLYLLIPIYLAGKWQQASGVVPRF